MSKISIAEKQEAGGELGCLDYLMYAIVIAILLFAAYVIFGGLLTQGMP